MNLILFSPQEQVGHYPLTFTRPAAELRMGILTFTERAEKVLGVKASFFTDEYLSEKFPLVEEKENLFLNPMWVPSQKIWNEIKNLKSGEALYDNQKCIAFKGSMSHFLKGESQSTSQTKAQVQWVLRPYHLFQYNDKALEYDFHFLTSGRESQPISATNGVMKPENIFIEKGAMVEYSVLNASTGYIYIGENAEVSEGSLIRGGLALCHNAKLNLGTKIYGTTTIGPYCKVGGEVNNSILTAYSNKGHDGFLGNSVIGEWCNLGADTNNSNLKNNYSDVKLWDYNTQHYENTGLQFCGLIMGDHAKSAINSQFNTGTVVEPYANIFKSGFPPNRVKAFSWGGKNDDERFRLDAAFQVAERMMSRRNVEFSTADKKITEYLFNKL